MIQTRLMTMMLEFLLEDNQCGLHHLIGNWLMRHIHTVKEQIVSKLDQGPTRHSHDNNSTQERKALTTLKS